MSEAIEITSIGRSHGRLTGPIFLRAVDQLHSLEFRSARSKDWPVNQQRCVTGKGSRGERSGSVQLTEEQANAHGDIAIHLRLSRRSRHEVTATPALVQRHPPHMDLLFFQGTSEPHRIG